MNRVQTWIVNNPNEIQPVVDRYCFNHNCKIFTISVTYDTTAKCYVVVGVVGI